MIPLAIVTATALALVYALWRVCYGHVPPDAPQVLCFHKVSRRFHFEGTWTTPSRFAATIDRLLERGYHFIDENSYLRSLESGREDRARELFLTFDDGYESVFTEAFPLLAARSIPFHIFIVSDFCGKHNDWELSLARAPSRHASWQQLREMSGAGATVGSHTATHTDLTRVSPTRRRDEIIGSRAVIEDRMGMAVRTISYPFGRCNKEVQQCAAQAGYEAGFSLYPRRNNSRLERFDLRRNGVYIIDPSWWVERKLYRNRFFWFEEMKCRSINAVAVLTPMLKRPSPARRGPDSEGRNAPGSRSATG